MKNTQNWQLFTFMSVFGKATPCRSEYIYTHTLLPLTRASGAPPHTCYARSTARSSSILYPCENTQEYLEICMGGMTFCVFWHDPCVFVMFSRASAIGSARLGAKKRPEFPATVLYLVAEHPPTVMVW
jgi:hypothetical protein